MSNSVTLVHDVALAAICEENEKLRQELTALRLVAEAAEEICFDKSINDIAADTLRERLGDWREVNGK